MAVVFRQNDREDTYDLTIDGRAAEYDIDPPDLKAALSRQRGRIPKDAVIYVEDRSGYRTRLGR
jgi:hypothetical protein